MKPEIQSSALVMSGEEEAITFVVMYVLTTFLCVVVCVAVCTSSLLVCVNGDDV